MSTRATKSRPIIFSGPMICAILKGRKSMTRRIVKPQPMPNDSHSLPWRWKEHQFNPYQHSSIGNFSPYGAPGDTLYVRERLEASDDEVWYAADGAEVDVVNRPVRVWEHREGTISPIHMPRWASRITLEITGVKVEQVQSISHRDALAEGVEYDVSKPDGSPIERFKSKWREINGAESWDSNVWVWCISFKAVKA